MVQIFRALRGVTHPVVDQALAQALPTAERQARRLIVLSLLERRDDKALTAVVSHYHLLGRELKQIIIDQVAALDTALRNAGREGDAVVRLNIVDIVASAGAFHLSYLLAAQLHSDESRVTRAAGAALLKLADELAAAAPGSRAVGPRPVAWLGAALAEACACYHQHGRHDVLMAVARFMPRRHRRLDPHLVDRRSHAHNALRDMIRYGDRDEMLAACLGFAALEPLRTPVLEALSRSDITPRLSHVLGLAHLTAVPAIHTSIRRITDARHLLPTSAVLEQMPPAHQRLAARWIRTLHVTTPDRLAGLARLGACEDAATRLLALKAVIDLSHADGEADAVISTFCFDPSTAIARIAYRHLCRRRWEGLLRLSVRLVGSPHADLRRMAERQLASVSFARLWDQWANLDPVMRSHAGRALMKIEANFHQHIADRLADRDPDVRFKAVGMVRELGLESYFEPRLIELTADESGRVAASATAALGLAATGVQAATESLKEALKHPDDRVRANAVESLQQLGKASEAMELLLEMARGSGNRSRANALKALLQMPMSEALPALAAMLVDADPRHRISALWVVERLDLARLGHRVGKLAKLDGDHAVKRRALRVLRKLAKMERAV